MVLQLLIIASLRTAFCIKCRMKQKTGRKEGEEGGRKGEREGGREEGREGKIKKK